ncbi:XylR family transcriptional regulator [Symmachiella dynata]|uniref:XylR family transcriptional regulator n=1 Tax=Symmachiella dynata TaxID=2527995 RepID=UPI0030EDB1A8
MTAGALTHAKPAGVIAHVANQELGDVLRSLQIPVINTSFMLPDGLFPRVGVDNWQIGQYASNHFLERGFQHFAVVGHEGHFYSEEREAGFRCVLQKKDHTCASFYQRSDPRFPMEVTPLNAMRELQQWLSKLPTPVGIFTCRGLWGIQLTEICRLIGRRVPEDVAVVCVDNDEVLCESSRPSLSSITVPLERIGFEAATLLDRVLEGKQLGGLRSHHATAGKGKSRPGNGWSPQIVPKLIPPTGVITRQSSDVFACEDPDVAAALRFIYKHAQRSINVADVLDEVPVPRRILEKKFRFKLDRGIAEQISLVRIERAKFLLASTSFTIAEVATQVGFTNVQYLSRVFRKKAGLTPSAFRHQFCETRVSATD